MKPPRIDPARLRVFAEAHVQSILAAVKATGPWLDQSAEEYAVEVTAAMVAAVQRVGIPGIEHYYLNAQGGALAATCAALGIERELLADYIGGK